MKNFKFLNKKMKLKKQLYNIDPRFWTLEELFRETFYFVESTTKEKFLMWELHNEKYKFEQLIGYIKTIAFIKDDKELTIVFFMFELIDGHIICFYGTEGNYSDFCMIEKYVENICPRDKDNRFKKTDITNFEHCLNAIDDFKKIDFHKIGKELYVDDFKK